MKIINDENPSGLSDIHVRRLEIKKSTVLYKLKLRNPERSRYLAIVNPEGWGRLLYQGTINAERYGVEDTTKECDGAPKKIMNGEISAVLPLIRSITYSNENEINSRR